MQLQVVPLLRTTFTHMEVVKHAAGSERGSDG